MIEWLCRCCNETEFTSPIDTDGGLYVRCMNCHTLYQQSSLKPLDKLVEKFEGEQDRFYGDDSVMLTEAFEALQKGTLKRRFDLIRQHLKSGHIFEVGPGNGQVLRLLEKHGYEIDAIEHSPTLVRSLQKSTKSNILCGDFNQLDVVEQYDAYLSFHVIEHIPNFQAHLAKAAEITRPGGLAFLATPNACSLEHKISRGLAPNFSSAHLQLFSKRGLVLCLEKHGWELVSVATPEYTMSWLRMITAYLRYFQNSAKTTKRGAFAGSVNSKTRNVIRMFGVVTWPLRMLQEIAGLGNEIMIVARKK